MKTKVNTTMIFAMILFGITLVVNYLSSAGILFSYTQQEVSDMYTNVLAPAGFTFSIWGVIYVGVILTLIIPFLGSTSPALQELYLKKLAPLQIAWMILNIVWNIAWTSDQILIAMVAIIVYTLVLLRMVQVLDQNKTLAYEKPVMLLWPIGLHAGWLTFASFTNIMTLLVKSGFNGVGSSGVTITIILMILAVILVLMIYKRFDNAAITVPALWALFGIIMKQRPGSDFAHANTIVMIAGIVLLIFALVVHIRFLSEHRKNRPVH